MFSVVLHILLDKLDMLHKHDYVIAKFVPEHVKKRSMEYCQSSILVVRIFNEIFVLPEEKEGEGDYTIATIVSIIRDSDQFRMLPSHIKNNRDSQPNAMKNKLEEYLREKFDCMYEKRRQRFVRGFRRTRDDTMSVVSGSEYDLLSEASTDLL